MNKKKYLYDEIMCILKENPATRSSDKRLIWVLFERRIGAVESREVMYSHEFLNLPAFESITRARRKVQEHHPELKATRIVTKARKEAQKDWGRKTFLKGLFES